MQVIYYPFIALLSGVIVSLILGKWKKGDIGRIIAILSLIVAIVLMAFYKPFNGQTLLENSLKLDKFAEFFSYLFFVLAIAVIIGTMKLMDNQPEMPALILLSSMGMSLVALSNDLIVLFVSWELMSITTYALVGLSRKEESTEAAMKYFIFGIVASALVLFAISLIYGIAGTTNFTSLASFLTQMSKDQIAPIVLAGALLIFGFGYKMGMVPFHLWLPDAYEGAPKPMTAYIAGVAKKVALVAFARIIYESLMYADFDWKLLLALVALVTMTVGNVVALAQKNVARMFAYSSISQVGYILVGFAAMTKEGLGGAIYQILTHAVTTVGAFIAVGIIERSLEIKTVEEYKGLGKKRPVVGISLSIMMLSLAGIPPLAGFISKLTVFQAAVNGGLLWLAILGVLNSVLSLGYYLPLIKNMFLDEPNEKVAEKEIITEKRCVGPFAILVISALALIVIPIVGEPLYNLIISAGGLW